MSLLDIFGKNLRRHRMEKNLSQERLAELCDLHRTYISDIERGQRNISLGNIEKIATALSIKPYELFMENHDEEN